MRQAPPCTQHTFLFVVPSDRDVQPVGCHPISIGSSGRDGLYSDSGPHLLVDPSPVPAPVRVLVFGGVH